MKQTHLPKDDNQRAQLIKKLQQKLSTLTNTNKQPLKTIVQQIKIKQDQEDKLVVEDLSGLEISKLSASDLDYSPEFGELDRNKDKLSDQKFVEIIKLRLKLIGDCAELSVQRIEHLEEIFKHYCTHIFKTGKHMTFERLEYEKVHLTLDRLCVFLKDFGLIAIKIEGTEHEIIDKNVVIRNFKRLSKNCRDLSFQQFIACLQKLAIVYYDEKQVYQKKMNKNKQQRDARIAQYRKRMKQKKKEQEIRRIQIENLKNKNKQKVQQQLKYNQEPQQKNKQENDDLVQKMMEDQKIQNPNDQLNKALDKPIQDNQFGNQSKIIKKSKIKSQIKGQIKKEEEIPVEYQLTVQEKIQYFYQLIGVDNAHDFRKKMSELGLPLFKTYQTQSKQPLHKRSTSTKASNQLLNVVMQNDQEDERRLIELRQKLNIKRQRDKHLYSPLMSKQQYQQRKKKREERQSQLTRQMNASKVSGGDASNSSLRQKQKQRKKIEITNQQLSLDMLNHLSLDDLKNKFDPKKYVHDDQSDKVYLNQYGGGVQPYRVKKDNGAKSIIRQNTAQVLERKRTSSNIVQDFKKRAYEMQVKQFHKEAELTKFVNEMKKRQKWRKQII